MTATDWIGFIGVFQILLAYVLHVIGKLDKDDLPFILLNLMRASLACYASMLMNYIPFILLEGIWASVSLYALITYKKQNRKPLN